MIRAYAILVAGGLLLAAWPAAGSAPGPAEPPERRQPKEQRRRPVLQSEAKLRDVIEQTNLELRQLKRDFMQQMLDVYLRLKLHPRLGYERARDGRAPAASANLLIAEEFASMAVKRHIIQRRLLAGLKLLFVKLLPMDTLVRLHRRHGPTFGWIRDQEQIDIRAPFAGAKGE